MQNIIEKYYDETGSRYRMSSTRRDRVLDLVTRAIARLKDDTASVLDIGIGSGEVAEHCRTLSVRKACRIVGVDISPRLLEAHADLYDEVRVVNVDSENWIHEIGDRYDIVVASELVEHLFRPDIFFDAVSKVVKPEGFLVISTPNVLLWSQRIKFLFGRHEWSSGGVFEWGHIHLFSWPFLQRELDRSGFRIVDTQHLLYPNSLNRWHKVISPGLFAFQFIVLAQKK